MDHHGKQQVMSSNTVYEKIKKHDKVPNNDVHELCLICSFSKKKYPDKA